MKRRGNALFVAPWVIAIALGCQTQQSFTTPEPGLERMLDQARVDPFEGSELYANGMGMRPSPPFSIPVERKIGDPLVILGIDKGVYADHVPIPVDRALLARGRERFEILCATCHGITGDGESVVAENMDLNKPPSLQEERIRAFPAGRLYRVIRTGYGLMPSYATQLSVEERWAVVAYVHALVLSRSAKVAALPADVRAALDREAP